jgi:hypothetical protein
MRAHTHSGLDKTKTTLTLTFPSFAGPLPTPTIKSSSLSYKKVKCITNHHIMEAIPIINANGGAAARHGSRCDSCG